MDFTLLAAIFQSGRQNTVFLVILVVMVKNSSGCFLNIFFSGQGIIKNFQDNPCKPFSKMATRNIFHRLFQTDDCMCIFRNDVLSHILCGAVWKLTQSLVQNLLVVDNKLFDMEPTGN